MSGTDFTTSNYLWNGEALLATTVHSPQPTTYFYVSDANKNISEVVAQDGTIAAHYEYSPFGKLTKETINDQRLTANGQPFRFSSEYCDKETGLVYYNYRYYNPELGSWLSKDPIEEQGGLNLYGFVGNNGVNNWDLWGYLNCSKKSDIGKYEFYKEKRLATNPMNKKTEIIVNKEILDFKDQLKKAIIKFGLAKAIKYMAKKVGLQAGASLAQIHAKIVFLVTDMTASRYLSNLVITKYFYYCTCKDGKIIKLKGSEMDERDYGEFGIDFTKEKNKRRVKDDAKSMREEIERLVQDRMKKL